MITFVTCCYCLLGCSRLSPYFVGGLGEGAWEGCATVERLSITRMPLGLIPSMAAGSPPGATPTMPGGYLRSTQEKGLVKFRIRKLPTSWLCLFYGIYIYKYSNFLPPKQGEIHRCQCLNFLIHKQ